MKNLFLALSSPDGRWLLSRCLSFPGLRLLFLFLYAFTSCAFWDPPLPLGSIRDPGGSHRTGQPDDGVSAQAETLFLVAAMRFPDSYDWRLDSLYDAAEASLCLYRDDQLCFEVPAGRRHHISLAPGLHHLVEGRLISEFADADGTWVHVDGQLRLHYPDAEALCGVILHDDALFTLGHAPGKGGFCLRKDGTLLLKKDRGRVLGGFCETGYDGGGALYRDGGQLCFAYASPEDDKETVCLVRDGREEFLLRSASARVLDVKSIGGTVYVAYNEGETTYIGHDGVMDALCYGPHNYWTEGKLLLLGGRLHLAGWFRDHASASSTLCIADPLRIADLGPELHYLYAAEDGFIRSIRAPDRQRDSVYFFSRDCACVLGADLFAVFTPRSGPSLSCLCRNGAPVRTWPVHGYLMGVSADISPPN